jgi:sugar phosphate isomerase/epimerase
MPLRAGDLVLCSGTLPRAVSFTERVEAAVAGDFAGISLWCRDYWAARREGFSDGDIRAILADHGLCVAEIDPAWWWPPGVDLVSIPAEADSEEIFRYAEAEVFRIAEAVGARSLNAVDVFGGDWGIDQAAETFAALCDRAAGQGLLVHIEFLPWSRIPNLATAWEIVHGADRPNGGLAIDAWHWNRGGGDASLLRSIPGKHVTAVQLSDGPLRPEEDLLHATLHERRLPGAGEFDLESLVALLDETGAAAPIGLEVFSDDLHALAPSEGARRAGDAARRLVGRRL